MTLLRAGRIVLLVTLVSGLAALASLAEETVRDGLFIHISHGADQPRRALMPLKMAAMMTADRDVLVYLDIDAVGLAVKGAPALALEPDFPSSQMLLATLLDKGATVMVCPTCLKVAGKTEADLLPGVRLADKDAFFTFTKGRILSLDY